MSKLTRLLNKVFGTVRSVEPSVIHTDISSDELAIIRKFGVPSSVLSDNIAQSTRINYERTSIYKEVDRSLAHWMMGAAAELYADAATTYNTVNNARVWITASSQKYENVLTNFLFDIGLEERLFDWAWSIGAYGDLFVKPNCVPGIGVIAVEDSMHPSSVSRVDYNGVLLGFYDSPYGFAGDSYTTELYSPWTYVHFRLLGAKKRRMMQDDSSYQEYNTVHLMGPETKQISTKYGTSLLLNGLPIYKRLRLAEDALFMARLTRGITKYLYKIKVDAKQPADAAFNLVDSYKNILKEARAVNLGSGELHFDSKANPMSVMEDLFIPVFGDVGDISIEKLGGETDIRWIADIEELRNQLACALRTPLSLLGGFTQESTGALGATSIEKQDIRFARNSRRLQYALIHGITRLCQIHLSLCGMDPDPKLFEVQMSHGSTAEEAELKESLETSMRVVRDVMDVFAAADERLDKIALLGYLNDKLLKLNDLKIATLYTKEVEPFNESKKTETVDEKKDERNTLRSINNLDLYSYLPIRADIDTTLKKETDWEKLFEDALPENRKKVVIKAVKSADEK